MHDYSAVLVQGTSQLFTGLLEAERRKGYCINQGDLLIRITVIAQRKEKSAALGRKTDSENFLHSILQQYHNFLQPTQTPS